ncbi:MAG: dTMP kinase [Planctomycetes bacterium]|nr:dTMP kinase [Planctomycetota bacterium]
MTAEGRTRGRFFVVDGVDGCGKTTQATLLARALGVRADLHLREPGSTPLGEKLRELLLSRAFDIQPATETLLFAAARRQMLDTVVEPALAAGEDVVCERFHPSTFAYQAVAGGLDAEEVLMLLHTWAGSPEPDLVILLDVDVDEAARRRGAATDRIEAKGLAFQRAVAEGMRQYARRFAGCVLIDGSGDADAVHAAVLAEVARVGA